MAELLECYFREAGWEWRCPLWASIRATGLDPDVDVAGFVCKPFEPMELVAEIRRVLEHAVAISGPHSIPHSVGP